jgi:hypothetical protein
MPPVTDAGSKPQVCTQWKSRNSSTTKSRTSTTKKILGDKVAQVLQQNTNLSDKNSEAYRTPSEKLKKDPVMALVSKTVATYMFVRHSNGDKRSHKTTDFASWAKPFFKKKE